MNGPAAAGGGKIQHEMKLEKKEKEESKTNQPKSQTYLAIPYYGMIIPMGQGWAQRHSQHQTNTFEKIRTNINSYNTST